MILRTLGIVVLCAALGATADLAIIAAGAFGVMLAPDSILVDVAAILAYFTFIPSVAVSVLAMLIGALMVFGHRSPQWLAKTLVVLGIVSAALVGLAYIPAPNLAPAAASTIG